MFKRFVALMLAAASALCLAACAKTPVDITEGENAPAPTGRWIETRLDTGDAGVINALYALESGEIWAFCYKTDENGEISELTKLVSKDSGDTWESQPTGWESIANLNPHPSDVLPDGTALLPAYENGAVKLYIQKPGAEPAEVKLPEGISSINRAVLIDEGTALLTGYSGDSAYGYLYDLLKGEIVAELPGAANSFSFAVDRSDSEPYLYYYTYDENGQGLVRTDKAGNTENIDTNADGYIMAAVCDSDGNLYNASSDGIYRMAKGGALTEQVIDVNGMSISADTPVSMVKVGDDFIVLIFGETDTYLCRYHFDPSLPAAADKKLTVWSLYNSNTARKAIVAFRNSHPEVDVEFVNAVEDGMEVDDAIRTLNTELLSGEGPDVLILDSMNGEIMASKGLLADLSTAVDADRLLPGIADAYCTEKGTFMLPARFTMPVVCGMAGTLDKINTLDKLKEAVLANAPRPYGDLNSEEYYKPLPESERYAMCFSGSENLTEYLLFTSQSELISNNAVNEEAARKLFSFAMEVGRHYNMQSYPDQSGGGTVSYSSYNGGDKAALDPVTIPEAMSEYNYGRALYGWTTLYSPADLTSAADTDSGKVSGDAAPAPGLTEGAYRPQVITALNANTKVKQEALELVAMMFSDEQQCTYTTDGMPVTKSAMQSSIDRQKNIIAKEGCVTDIEALINAIKSPVVTEATVAKAFAEQVNLLNTGAIDVDGAVQSFKDKLSIYLAERQQ